MTLDQVQHWRRDSPLACQLECPAHLRGGGREFGHNMLFIPEVREDFSGKHEAPRWFVCDDTLEKVALVFPGAGNAEDQVIDHGVSGIQEGDDDGGGGDHQGKGELADFPGLFWLQPECPADQLAHDVGAQVADGGEQGKGQLTHESGQSCRGPGSACKRCCERRVAGPSNLLRHGDDFLVQFLAQGGKRESGVVDGPVFLVDEGEVLAVQHFPGQHPAHPVQHFGEAGAVGFGQGDPGAVFPGQLAVAVAVVADVLEKEGAGRCLFRSAGLGFVA